MSSSGKTLTIFLVVISILFLSLTVIALFFYQNESKIRKEKEAALAQSQAMGARLNAELKEVKKEKNRLEEKSKDDDEKINNLMDEVELERGIGDQLKLENAAIREEIIRESKEKNGLQKTIIALKEDVFSLKKQLSSEKMAHQETKEETEVIEKKTIGRTPEETPQKTPQEAPQEVKQEPHEGVRLDKIVVKTVQVSEGRILKVNREENFVIFDLGLNQGISEGMELSVYRKNKNIGDIKAVRVQNDMSVADAIPPLTIKRIRSNYKVVVKE